MDLLKLKRLAVISSIGLPSSTRGLSTTIFISGCPNLETLEISRINSLVLSDEIGNSLKSIKTSSDTDLENLHANELPVLKEISYYSKSLDTIGRNIKQLNPKVVINHDLSRKVDAFLTLKPYKDDKVLDL